MVDFHSSTSPSLGAGSPPTWRGQDTRPDDNASTRLPTHLDSLAEGRAGSPWRGVRRAAKDRRATLSRLFGSERVRSSAPTAPAAESGPTCFAVGAGGLRACSSCMRPGTFGTACLTPLGRLCALLAVPLYHWSRRATEDAGVSVSESMQDESALASLDLAGLESLRSICSSTALTALAADFRVRRPASVSAAWRTALVRRMRAPHHELESLQFV